MDSKAQALREYFDVLRKLQSERILINKKDFTCQIGEWLIEAIYDGSRATSGIQKGWDVEIKNKRIQVKTHAKAIGNSNRWSPVKDSPQDTLYRTIHARFI